MLKINNKRKKKNHLINKNKILMFYKNKLLKNKKINNQNHPKPLNFKSLAFQILYKKIKMINLLVKIKKKYLLKQK